VGWGSEGDDVSVVVAEDKQDCRKPISRRPSSLHSPPPLPSDNRHVQSEFRPSAETVRGLPVDYVKKSLSNALSPDQDGLISRRPSRPTLVSSPLRNASFSELSPSSPSPASASASSSSSSSPSPTTHRLYIGPTITITPARSPTTRSLSRSVSRGRRHQPYSTSRSPSPSITPTTPVEITTEHVFSNSIHVVDTPPSESRPDSSRGRSALGRDVRSRLADRSFADSDPGLAGNDKELDKLQDSSEWRNVKDRSGGGRISRRYTVDEGETTAVTAPATATGALRAGSSPPAPWSSKEEKVPVWRFSDPSGMRRYVRHAEADSTPPRPPRSQWRDRSA
jgi:hypothetical protein